MSHVLLQLQRNTKGKSKLGLGAAAVLMLFNFKHSFMCIITSCGYPTESISYKTQLVYTHNQKLHFGHSVPVLTLPSFSFLVTRLVVYFIGVKTSDDEYKLCKHIFYTSYHVKGIEICY